jgi:hypothetical protein
VTCCWRAAPGHPDVHPAAPRRGGTGHAVRIASSAAERELASRVARLAGLPGEHVLVGQTLLHALAALTASADL